MPEWDVQMYATAFATVTVEADDADAAKEAAEEEKFSHYEIDDLIDFTATEATVVE